MNDILKKGCSVGHMKPKCPIFELRTTKHLSVKVINDNPCFCYIGLSNFNDLRQKNGQKPRRTIMVLLIFTVQNLSLIIWNIVTRDIFDKFRN